MHEELRSLLLHLIDEFRPIQDEFLKEPKLIHAFKQGTHPRKGTKRALGAYSSERGILLDNRIFGILITRRLSNLESVKNIYQYIVKRDLWHVPFSDYNANVNTEPSINSAVCGGFLTRIFEVSGFKFLFNDLSFNQVFDELCSFLNKDYLEYELHIQLKGVYGEVPIVLLSDFVSIVKVDYELARYFCIHYNREDISETEMFEGDYVLRMKVQVPKWYYNHKMHTKEHNVQLVERKLRERWTALVILSIPGYLKIGKELMTSNDWPILGRFARGPYGDETFYTNVKFESINADFVENIKSSAKIMENVTFAELDKKIRYSIERLKKSKSSFSIDDKVVELSIAFEYLINTTKSDVTLQLCLKAIKLIDEKNQDPEIFSKLKKFYGLRSHIIHGNDKVEANAVNNSLIQYTELVIQKATIRMIELNKKYTYAEIDKALTKALYISKPLEDLLIEG